MRNPGIDRSGAVRPCGGARAFTLIEILLALFLAAVVLVSVNLFVFSMGELWGRGGDDRLFDRHVNGVTRFLQNSIDRATAEMRPEPEGRDAGGRLASTYLGEPPSDRGFGEKYITFELLESPGLLIWPERPLPFVVCYLEFAGDEGLFLLWHSRLEEGFEDDPPRRTRLSPFARAPVFEYYDPENESWSERRDFDTDAEGNDLLPDRVRIPFVSEKRETERVVSLYGHRQGAVGSAVQ